jgi:hypothetical protein
MLQVNGEVPPLADKVAMYEDPTIPAGSEVVVMVRALAMVMLRVALPVRELASVTFTTKLYRPDSVGVPPIVPLFAFRPKPGGKVPEEMLQENGAVPRLAESVALYAEPAVPPGNDEVEITGEFDPLLELPLPPQATSRMQHARTAAPETKCWHNIFIIV